MSAVLLAISLLAAADPLDWFRVYQYAGKTAKLRGCSECQGEPDDVCEVPPGAQSRALDEYAAQPAPPGRVRLLRSKADPDCAARANAFFASRGEVELAAARLAHAPPSAALVERLGVGLAVAGWPRAPQRRKGAQLLPAAPDRNGLRLALLCWGSERGWPASAPASRTTCEWWLLPVRSDGEPDLAGRSFPLLSRRDRWPEQFRFGDARWSGAFDPARPFGESALLCEAEARPEPPAAPPPPPAPAPQAGTSRCGEEARARTAVLDRFDQWERQITGARRSLDRAAFTLDAAAWSGHCPELDVLRSVLEQQLGCAVGQEGRCLGPSEGSP